jgi:uncharacterized membrane protein
MLDTNCFIPTYAMDSIETVERCSSQSGRMIAIMFTIIIIIITLILYYTAESEYEKAVNKEKAYKPNIFIYLGIASIFIVLSWLLLPNAVKFFNTMRWKQNETMINNYIKQGMTRAEAVNRISTLREAQEQRDATLQAGQEQARATNNLARALLNKNN